MEEHKLNSISVHTQLLQMQNEINIKMMNDRFHASQNELQSTKVTLQTTQNKLQTTIVELQATKIKLDHTENELKMVKEEAEKKEEQISVLQDNIQKQIEQVQNQNHIGLRLNQQIAEGFAACYSGMLNENHAQLELDSFIKHFETKRLEIEPLIEPLDINETKIEFSKFNQLVKEIPYFINYEKKFKLLLKSMESGVIYQLKTKQLIFKLHLPNKHRTFCIYHHHDILSLERESAYKVIIDNDQMLVLDNRNPHPPKYQIYLQIPNYNKETSTIYMYPKKEEGEKFFLKYGWNNELNFDGFKSKTMEILFHITKTI